MTTTAYPVHVDASLDAPLSRWLWLVKWILLIPHFFVLVFLWAAFLVLSVLAFFGILFTGRYPRNIFEFNVGVLRWSWRVAYYAYGALGTDRYPPFTLHEVPAFPAHLEVEYPEHLSRGLVLVKWWLLAIPHYIIVGILLGGTAYAVEASRDNAAYSSTGLIGILVLIAGVLLLFTGRYPQQLFDLVLGLNRWVIRVAGYVSLMTDRYPPFALDQGGHEDPAGASLVAPRQAESSAAQPKAPEPDSSGWTGGRVVSLVLGAFLVLSSLSMAIPAGLLMAADLGARNHAGFLVSDSRLITTPTFAATSSNLELHADSPTGFMPDALLGDAQITAKARGDDEIFVGIAPTADVQSYLDDVEYASLTAIRNGRLIFEPHVGQAPAMPPVESDIWTVQSSGPGVQNITWEPRNGDWTVVLMNADGAANVSALTTVGAEVPALGWVVGILFTLAGIALVVGIVLIAVPLLSVSKDGGQQ